MALTVAKVEWNILFSKCRPSDRELSYPEIMIINRQLVPKSSNRTN